MPRKPPHVTGVFRDGRFDFDTSTLVLGIEDATVCPMPTERGTAIEVFIRPARPEPSTSGITLGELIDQVRALPTEIRYFKHAPGCPHSYRMDPSALAFELHSQKDVTAAAFLERIAECDGEIFEAYKGGEMKMGRQSFVYLASHGAPGDPILGVGHSLDSEHAWLIFDQEAPGA